VCLLSSPEIGPTSSQKFSTSKPELCFNDITAVNYPGNDIKVEGRCKIIVGIVPLVTMGRPTVWMCESLMGSVTYMIRNIRGEREV
jgi:hypothetical protein